MRSSVISQVQGRNAFFIPFYLVVIGINEHSTGGPSQCNRTRKKYMLYANIRKADIKMPFLYCLHNMTACLENSGDSTGKQLRINEISISSEI